jgi:hypothetical protein
LALAVEVWAKNRIAKNSLIGSVTIPRVLLAHVPNRQQEFWYECGTSLFVLFFKERATLAIEDAACIILAIGYPNH